MWEEFLTSDTHADGPGSTVGRYLAGEVWPMSVTGMAGVTNPGLDTNWCGHHFSQSNWYAFARLAWNHQQRAEEIADDWIRETFTNEQETVDVIRDMMMRSREIFVNYTMPCGLHHLIGGDHYAPMPQNARSSRPSWTATYYHQAAEDGIGFDRTETGSNNVAQYHPPVRDMFASLEECPEEYLLWFHRLGWDHQMGSGLTLWAELCARYHQGARDAAGLEETWASLEGRVDAQRHREVAERLQEQVRHAAEWRDQILGYFQQFSGMDIVDPTNDA
jgi:alpha-glucuronidase